MNLSTISRRVGILKYRIALDLVYTLSSKPIPHETLAFVKT